MRVTGKLASGREGGISLAKPRAGGVLGNIVKSVCSACLNQARGIKPNVLLSSSAHSARIAAGANPDWLLLSAYTLSARLFRGCLREDRPARVYSSTLLEKSPPPALEPEVEQSPGYLSRGWTIPAKKYVLSCRYIVLNELAKILLSAATNAPTYTAISLLLKNNNNHSNDFGISAISYNIVLRNNNIG